MERKDRTTIRDASQLSGEVDADLLRVIDNIQKDLGDKEDKKDAAKKFKELRETTSKLFEKGGISQKPGEQISVTAADQAQITAL